MNWQKLKDQFTTAQLFFIVAVFSLILLNNIAFGFEIKRILSYKKVIPHQNIGYKFAGLKEYIPNSTIGYFTDGDLADHETLKLLSQAQYRLAPIVLDYSSIKYEYMLIVVKDSQNAVRFMEKLNLEPLLRNNFGVILAKRK
jgi:hypothetical protein